MTVKIFLPDFTINKNEIIYFKGHINTTEQKEIVIYVTEYTRTKFVLEPNSEDLTIYGCYSHKTLKKNKMYSTNLLVLEKHKTYHISQLIIAGKTVATVDRCVIMLYDYNIIKNSETITDSGSDFFKLQILIQNKCDQTQRSMHVEDSGLRSPLWLSSSMFAQHLFNYVNLVNWLRHTIRRDRKVSIKQGNLILAILTDVILGYIILQLITQDKTDLSIMLMSVLEKLVNLLYSLLKWLMGAPAGLKLNNAFNKMLGKYFSYHIQLWWLFLDVSGEKLDIILHIYHYLGYLGSTFQAAIISDMICIATFHSYCIYVYAARLFNIQISGLIALLRLFVGRKYNPLRGGIDSCEYTNQELFVGTVAFTILLLLLPTTTMYYIVFTVFRLLSLLVQYVLAKLIYLIQTLPIYVVVLWTARSSKVAGNILIEMVNSEEKKPLILRVKLFNKSVQELVNNFKPPVEALNHIEWSNLLTNVFTGKQII